jgi:polysaccharide export outer membrane protein
VRIAIALTLTAMVVGAALAQPVAVRPGDTLNISVLGEDKLSGKMVVSEDGMIALPLAGEIRVEGCTTADLTRVLTERLGQYIKDPQVTVDIAVRAQLKVAVSGGVKSPGIYPVPPDSRLADALAAAGGTVAAVGGSGLEADLSQVSLVRSGDKPQVLDFKRFLEQGDETQNPRLSPGDHVIVALQKEPPNSCQVLGQVVRPGAYEVTGTVTPWDLVAKAGGSLPGANLQQAVLRPATGQAQVIDLEALLTPQAMASAPILNPGDTLVIPGFTTQIYVLGGVKTPGPVFVRSDARLLDAIATAGGVTETARLEEAFVLRASTNSAQAMRIPTNLRKLLMEGDMRLNIQLRPGDTLFVPSRLPPRAGRSFLQQAASILGPLAYLLGW